MPQCRRAAGQKCQILQKILVFESKNLKFNTFQYFYVFFFKKIGSSMPNCVHNLKNKKKSFGCAKESTFKMTATRLSGQVECKIITS